MSVHLGWFVVAERVSIDADTHLISVTDCVEQLFSEVFPATVPRLVCAAYLYRDDAAEPQQVALRVVVEPPGRPEVVVIEGHATFDAGNPRARVRFVLDMFQFKTAGRYGFRLDWMGPSGWEAVARSPVDLGARAVGEEPVVADRAGEPAPPAASQGRRKRQAPKPG